MGVLFFLLKIVQKSDFGCNLADIYAVLTNVIALRVFLENRTRKLNWKLAG